MSMQVPTRVIGNTELKPSKFIKINIKKLLARNYELQKAMRFLRKIEILEEI